MSMHDHIEACKADAAKLYGCDKKDVLAKPLRDGGVYVRMKNAAKKDRK